MIVRTGLLISDDPDDHIEFSEALYEISDDMVLLSVAHAGKAMELLSLKKYIPEYIFINLAVSGFNFELLFNTLEDPALKLVKVIAYGESPHFGNLPGSRRITAFLDADVSYSELKEFLQKVVKGGSA